MHAQTGVTYYFNVSDIYFQSHNYSIPQNFLLYGMKLYNLKYGMYKIPQLTINSQTMTLYIFNATS